MNFERDEVNVERAWERFRERRLREAARRRWAWPSAWPKWTGAAAAVALAAALGLSPAARSASVRVLSLFRATSIAAIPLNNAANAPLANRGTAQLIRNLIADNLTVTEHEANQTAASAAQASALAGFAVRYAPEWQGQAPSQFEIQGGRAFQVTVDRSRAQSVLEAAGVEGVTLPETLDGASVAVQIPRAVAIEYGHCLQGQKTPITAGCTALGEGPSPVVSLPPGVDMKKLAAAGLQLLGMTPEEAQQYVGTVDWKTTLVVPFPAKEAQSRTVPVDGTQGLLLNVNARQGTPAGYALLWNRSGIFYCISGAGDGSQGLALADELTH